MIRKTLAALAIVAMACAACTRGQGAGSNATPDQVYGSGPTQGDVRSVLGSSDWWQVTPSFLVRPLDMPNIPENVRFGVGQQYVHIGTPETLSLTYFVYTSTTEATNTVNSRQSQLGSNVTTSPRAGDQSLYYGYKSFSNTALYSMFGIVRVGQVVINIDYERVSGFADLKLMGRVASKAASKLKDVLNGKVKPSPLPKADQKLLPPPGSIVTLVGATRLPVEALVGSLGTASPQSLVDDFHQFGVKDFLYADFALDADFTMEVKGSLFSFASADEATAWIDAAVGASNLDASGAAVGYSAASGQYVGFFIASSYVGIVFCVSTNPGEAASRACEAPFSELITAWQQTLTSQ